MALSVRPERLDPNGVLHGGLPDILVDYAMGAALNTRLEPGEHCATLEIKIQYLAAVRAGTVRAGAAVVSRTRRVGVLEARVHGDDERLVALATGTFFIQAAAPAADSSSAAR